MVGELSFIVAVALIPLRPSEDLFVLEKARNQGIATLTTVEVSEPFREEDLREYFADNVSLSDDKVLKLFIGIYQTRFLIASLPRGTTERDRVSYCFGVSLTVTSLN